MGAKPHAVLLYGWKVDGAPDFEEVEELDLEDNFIMTHGYADEHYAGVVIGSTPGWGAIDLLPAPFDWLEDVLELSSDQKFKLGEVQLYLASKGIHKPVATLWLISHWW
jgi:hypothetical protein